MNATHSNTATGAGPIRCLTLRQPYAEQVRSGAKTIEKRSWPTRYRGRLVICAAKARNRIGLPSGVCVCVADLVDCRPMRPGDEGPSCSQVDPGQFSWVLANVREIRHVPVVGRLGLYPPSADVIEALEELGQ